MFCLKKQKIRLMFSETWEGDRCSAMLW
jgi:hypothetical protein